MKINLIPWREKERVRRNKILIGILSIAILCGILTSLGIRKTIQYTIEKQNITNNYLNAEIKKVNIRIKKIILLKKEKTRLLTKLNAIQNLDIHRQFIVTLLNDITNIVPNKMQLLQLTKNTNNIIFKGIVNDDPTVAEFMKKLSKKRWTKEIILKEITKKSSKNSNPYKKPPTKKFILSVKYLMKNESTPIAISSLKDKK